MFALRAHGGASRPRGRFGESSRATARVARQDLLEEGRRLLWDRHALDRPFPGHSTSERALRGSTWPEAWTLFDTQARPQQLGFTGKARRRRWLAAASYGPIAHEGFRSGPFYGSRGDPAMLPNGTALPPDCAPSVPQAFGTCRASSWGLVVKCRLVVSSGQKLLTSSGSVLREKESSPPSGAGTPRRDRLQA